MVTGSSEPKVQTFSLAAVNLFYMGPSCKIGGKHGPKVLMDRDGFKRSISHFKRADKYWTMRSGDLYNHIISFGGIERKFMDGTPVSNCLQIGLKISLS